MPEADTEPIRIDTQHDCERRTAARHRGDSPLSAAAGWRRPSPWSPRWVAACGGAGGPAVTPVASEFWVDPTSAAARQVEQWRSEGRTDDAAALEKIARQPVAIWPTGETGGVEGEVAGVVSQARAAGRTPVLTAYNIPNRDCGQYSSGGAEDEGAYREWLDAFARGMGGTRSVVVLEPDALPADAHQLRGPGRAGGPRGAAGRGRPHALRRRRRGLHRRRQPRFRHRHRQARRRPAQVGRVGQAAGFALNVSNFMEHRAGRGVRRPGLRRSSATPATSSTPAATATGPTTAPSSRPGATRPAAPSAPRRPATPGRRGVAAFLWVKEPGDSDGDCRGAPSAGDFWPQYALDLAKPAQGTRAARAPGTASGRAGGLVRVHDGGHVLVAVAGGRRGGEAVAHGAWPAWCPCRPRACAAVIRSMSLMTPSSSNEGVYSPSIIALPLSCT